MSQKGCHYWTIIREWPNAYSISNPGHVAESRVKRQLSKQVQSTKNESETTSYEAERSVTKPILSKKEQI